VGILSRLENAIRGELNLTRVDKGVRYSFPRGTPEQPILSCVERACLRTACLFGGDQRESVPWSGDARIWGVCTICIACRQVLPFVEARVWADYRTGSETETHKVWLQVSWSTNTAARMFDESWCFDTVIKKSREEIELELDRAGLKCK